MSLHSTIAAFASAAVLAGCASKPPAAPPVPPPPSLALLLAQADAAVASKQEARAIAILKQATAAYPRDKSAWVRVAQVSFDCHLYGEAISYAKSALERDPDDMKAHSILAVSGLRVASHALRDLAQKNNVTGPVRLEAQQLAKFLRNSIGGDIIVPPRRVVHRPPVARPAAQDDNDPFRVFRGDMARDAKEGK